MNFRKSMLQKTLKVLMSLAIIISQIFFVFDKPIQVFGLDANVYIASSNGNTSFSGSAVVVDPNIEVDLHGQTDVTGARVAIQSGFVSGDTLYHPNASYNSTTGILTFSGNYSQATLQAYLRAVTFTASSASNTDLTTRTIGFTLGSGLYNEANGHFYRILSAGGYAWTGARDIAASDSNKLFGLRGYLVTITSAQENTFIMEKVQSSSWIGASDAGSEYYWKWQTGPEAGTHFFTQYTDRAHGVAVNGSYHNFAAGEPNGSGSGESYGEIIYSASYGSSGQWNDLANTNYRSSIIIEYGGMPGDPQSIISSTKNVEIASASLIFNSNSATSGTTPSTITKRINNSFTIPTNNLVKDGAQVIAWTTNADGSGTRYTTGNSITLSTNLTLYAQYGKYISASSGKTEYTNTPVVVDPNLVVDYKYETNIQGASVKISSGFVSGDTLAHPSGTYNSQTGVLTFFGTYTQSQMQELFRAVTFSPSTSSGSNLADRSITFQLGHYNSDTGHYYYHNPLAINSVSFFATNLSSNTLFGRQAYMLNVNSSVEASYIDSLIDDVVWLPALYENSTWTYKSGPISGTVIPKTNGNGIYTNWGTNEPSGTEIYIIFHNSFWFDVNQSNGSSDRLYTTMYEYGGYANEPTVITSATKVIDIIPYTVSFNANGATSGSVPSAQSLLYNAPISLSGNTGNLNKLGYDFNGWNTSADGTGTSYAVSSNYSSTSNRTLYAKWTPITLSSSIVVSQTSSTLNSASLTFSGLNSTYTSLKFAIVNHGNVAPSATEILNGQYASGASFIKTSTISTSGSSATTSVTSLPENFLLDAYAIQIDTYGNARVSTLTPKTIYANTIRAAYTFNNSLNDVTAQQRALIAKEYSGNTNDLGFQTSESSTFYNFDGTRVFILPNDIIARNDLVNNANNGLFTVSMNFKTNSNKGFGLLGYNGGQNPYDLSPSMAGFIPILSVSPTGYLYAILWQGSDFNVVSNYPVNDNQWHNVVLTASNNGTNQTLSVYVDGINIGSATGNLNHFNMNIVTLGTNVSTSRFDGTGNNYFNSTNRSGYWFKPFEGQIDDVIIYGQGLTSAQVQTVSSDIALEYALNGGSFSTAPQYLYSKTATSNYTLPSPTKSGFLFSGWYLSSNFSGSAVTEVTVGTSSNQKYYAKWTLAPIEYISGSESSVAYSTSALTIDSAIQVNLNGDERGFKKAQISISSGYSTGDVLSYTDTSNSFSTDPIGTFDSTTKTLTINGSYTSAQWQAILRDVKFSTTSTSTTTRTIKFEMVQTMSSLVVNGKTHYYELISSSGTTWSNAFSNASNLSLYGLSGYLASPVYETENNLLTELASSKTIIWIAGSDEATEGTWKWMSGPEAGTTFWTGGVNGTVSGFAKWHSGYQPSGEDYTIMVTSGVYAKLWGDEANTYASTNGYVVEYGGYDADVEHITSTTQDITFSASTLSFNANGSTYGSVPTGYSQRLNTIISLPTNSGNLSKTGYTFAGWNTQADGQGTNYTPGSNFTLSASTQTLYAKWTLNSYDLSFNSNSGSSIATQSIDYNLKATEPSNPTRSGYTFAGWYTDNTTFNNAFDFENTNITQDITLYAKWTLDTYSISYQLNGGSNALANPSTYTTTSSTITLADPSKDHYNFEGWYLESTFDTEITQIAVGSTGNKSLYAKYSPVSYSISYNLDGGSATTVSSYTIETSTLTLPSPTKVGYTFSHWIDLNNNNASVTSIPSGSFGNQSFKAVYTINSYALSFNSNGGSAVTTQSIDYATYATEPSIPTKAGYTFEAWYHDVNLSQAFDFNSDTITTAKTLYASWTINSYTLNFDSNGGSSIASQSKNYQQSFTQPTSPSRTGYQFDGWYTEETNFDTEYDFSSLVTGNTTIYAKWLIEVSYNMNYPDITTPSLSLVEANGSYSTLKSVGNVRPGYTLLGWYTSATGGDLISTTSLVTINTPHTLYAHWGLSVSLDKQDGSSITSYGNVKYGSTYAGYGSTAMSLPSPTRTGYEFDGWFSASTGGTEITSSSTVTLKDHHTLYAHWSAKTPTVTLDLSNGGSLGNNPTSFITSFDQAYGSSLIEPTRTEEGKYFLGWYTATTGGTLITETDLVSNESNHTLYAQWGTFESFVVTYHGNGNTSGSAPSAQSQFIDANTTISSKGTLSKTGYTFTGWNTQADGEGSDISVGTLFDTSEERVNTSLYAQWSANTYTVTLDKNDGSSTTQNISVTFDSPYSNLNNPFTRTGYTFGQWLDSNNQEITSSTTVSTASAHTLFAQWNPITYIATYFSQGGTFLTRPNWFEDVVSNQYGEDVSTSGTAIYSRYYGGTPTVSKTGYVFKEWNSAADETGTEVTGTSIVNIASDHNYYAIWTPATNTAYTVEYYQQNLGGTGYRLVDSQVFTGTTDSSITISPASFTGFDRETTNLSLTIQADGSSTKAIYYARQNRTLSFDSNGGSLVDPQVLQYQQVATQPTAPTRLGYTFAGWYTDDDSFANAYDFTSQVSTNISLHAKWTSNPYTISYNLNGGTATTVNSYTIETANLTLPTPTKTGYTFVSWHTSSNFSDQAVTQVPNGSTGNKVFYAKYSPISYSVSYTLNGGSASTVSNYTIESNQIDLPTAVRLGYTFVGWFDNANFTGSSIPSIPEGSTGNKSFYAKWTTNAYTLSYTLNGGTASTVSTYTIETPTLSLPTPIKTGYNFVRWENGSGMTVTNIPQGSTGNQSFTAIYSPIVYSISYNLNGGSASTLSSYTIESSRIDLPSPTKLGYTFNRWIDNDNNTVTSIPTGSIGNRFYTAIFDINSYYVNFNTLGGSSITPASVVYNTYLSQPLNPTKDGYTFDAWYEDANFSQAFDFNQSRITNTKTLYAKYSVNSYSINYELDGGIASNPSTYTIQSSNITFNAPTKTGYRFVAWYDNPNFTGSAISQISTGSFGNKTLYAKYENALYSLNYDSNGGFYVPETDVIFGENIPTLPIPRRDGYRFEGWYSNVALSNQFTTTLMPSQDINLYAKWSLIHYGLSYDTQGGSHSNPSAYSILNGFNLSPATRPGYVFEGWTLFGNPITEVQRGSTGDLVFVAKYRLAERMGSFANFSLSELTSESASFSFALADEGNPRYSSFRYTLNHPNLGTVQSGSINGSSFTLSGLEAYVNYSITLMATNGLSRIETSLSFTPRLTDTDNDGIPDVRDAYPNDPKKSYNTENLNPELTPVRALVADNNTSSEVSIRIDPKDLMGTSASDTILLVMGSTQFVIPVAILDTMIAKSLNEETYLSLKVEPQLLNTDIPEDLLDPENSTIVKAFDYLLMQVDQDGNETQIHELGGKIKIGVDLNTIVGEYDPENLEVYYYDPEDESLQVMSASYDPINHSIVFMTDHFSYYVLGVKKENDPTKTTLQLIFLAISLILAFVYWFKKNFNIVKK